MTLLRTLSIVTAALAFIVTTPAQARAANVVPNPGFEQAGCGSTPIICGWTSGDPMSRDTMDTHSGGASMVLWKECGPTGCYSGGFSASTDPAFCAGIGPGGHVASFWSGGGWGFVSLAAVFFQDPDCTAPLGSDSFGDSLTDSGWQELTGTLVAPPGTQSALFDVSAVVECDDFCFPQAKFDDLYVEDAAVAGPAIASFNPLAAPVGASVDIFGVNFTEATSVKFNGTAASFTVDSDSQIHATVPNGATTGPITVTTPIGTGTSSHLFGVQPTITSFTPTCGPAGSLVDILGSGFTGATTVTFSGTETSFTVDSDSEIHATVPGVWPGLISVTTPGGTGMSSSPFMGSCPSMDPTISSFTPMSGPRGTSVDILGTHFTGADWVYFNGSVADFTIDSDLEIHATVPSTATTGSIWITTPHGTATSSSWFTVIGDTAPPETTITSGPSGTTSSTSATFEFTADEPATFECGLDGAGFAACTSAKTYTDLVDGSHTFRVRAIDAAGNTDPVPAERTWTVATSPPPPPPASCTGAAITIRDSATASPYPSTCVVSGLSGTISDVNLRLSGLGHSYPDDVDLLLVSPGGQKAIVMSDAGGGLDIVNCSLRLDDEAASALPDSGQIACPGSYKPTNYGAGDPFPAPAPAPSGEVKLSSFDGGAPNGTWSLYVVDDAAADTGHIDSWSLSITSGGPPPPPPPPPSASCTGGAVTIRDNTTASPYPSTCVVSGLSGTVTDLDLTLSGLSHTYPDDIDVLLVSPDGQNAIVMSDAGTGLDVVNVNLTLDDEAASQLPDGAQIVSGSYRPANWPTLADPFPAPAPARSGAAALSTFDSGAANGTWSLYVVDDAGMDIGTLASWSLRITASG